jgi:diguanylate cyclase (GGDEF)-like protein
MSAPHNNAIAAVAPDQYFQVHMPQAQFALRVLLALVAAASCWQLAGTARNALMAGAAGYVPVQGLLGLVGWQRWGGRPALALGMTAIDVLASMAVIVLDPATTPPSALLLPAVLGLAASQQRSGYGLLAGLILLLGGAALATHQQMHQLPFDSGFLLLLLFLLAGSGTLLVLAQQMEQLQQRTARVTDLDELTGLGNRWTFYEAAKYLLPYRQRNLIPLAVMYADIELSGDTAHTLDGNTGAEVAKAFAAVSEQRLRNSDVAVRYGHNSFAFLLIDTVVKDAEQIARDLQNAFGQWAEEQGIPAQAYVGAAAVPDEAIALDQVLLNLQAGLQRSRHYRRSLAGNPPEQPV